MRVQALGVRYFHILLDRISVEIEPSADEQLSKRFQFSRRLERAVGHGAQDAPFPGKKRHSFVYLAEPVG